MRLVLAEPKFLRESVNIISELVNEVNFKANKEGISLVAMDPANVAMVNFRLLGSAFLEYEVNGDKSFSVSLDNFKQILRRAKPSDTLVIELDEDNNRLKVNLKGESERTFNLSLIDMEDKEQKVPELNFNASIEMNTGYFDEAIEDMDVVSDSVSLLAGNNKLIVQADGNVSNAKVEVASGEDILMKIKEGEVKSKYSVEYLKKIIKGSRLADKVKVEFSSDYPLKIEYKVMDKMVLSTILAPRVEN